MARSIPTNNIWGYIQVGDITIGSAAKIGKETAEETNKV
jgi:hypothetical protein